MTEAAKVATAFVAGVAAGLAAKSWTEEPNANVAREGAAL
jgi:hypothetical protein